MLDATAAGFRTWAADQRDHLRSTAYLLSGDWYLADDLVQEALTRLYAAWPRVARADHPHAYARRTLVNLYLDHTRRPWRREQPRDLLPDRVVYRDHVAAFDDRDRLMAALRRVPPGQRAVLVLRYWDDLSIDQTATVLGMSTGTVKSQASRGLAMLRTLMDADHLVATPPDPKERS